MIETKKVICADPECQEIFVVPIKSKAIFCPKTRKIHRKAKLSHAVMMKIYIGVKK